MKSRFVLAVAVAVVGVACVSSGADFHGLGDLAGGAYKSSAYGISGDGTVVVGYGSAATFQGAIRWTAGTGMTDLGNANPYYDVAYGASSNGTVIVGETSRQAFRWTSGGPVKLGYLPGATKSSARSVSSDGSVVVGFSATSGSVYEAFRWTASGGMVGLGTLPGGTQSSIATGVSSNGQVAVGVANSASGNEAFRWTSNGGMVGLGDLAGGTYSSYANGVSGDGSTIVGFGTSASGHEAFRWDAITGMTGLGDLPGGAFSSEAFAASADGSIVVGTCSTTFNVNDMARYGEAFIWTQAGGMQRLEDVLVGLGVDMTSWNGKSWTLTAATGISADGKTIVGYGYNDASPEAWVATIPEPGTLLLLGLGGLLAKGRLRKRI